MRGRLGGCIRARLLFWHCVCLACSQLQRDLLPSERPWSVTAWTNWVAVPQSCVVEEQAAGILSEAAEAAAAYERIGRC